MEIRKIADYFPKADCFNQRNALCIVIYLVAFTIFYLTRTKKPSSDLFPRVDTFTKKNLEAIKQKWYLTRFLFRGSLEKQEIIAKKMANDLGIPFHHFDGRTLKQNLGNFNHLLQRVSSSETPEFVFVSHADEICQRDKSALNIILYYTGDVSQKLLLCLGVSSKETLPRALASRYREQIIIGE